MRSKLPIAHEQSMLVIGKKYSVAHAILERPNGDIHKIAINPFKHKDPQFGANFYHYHIDGRFGMISWLRQNFRMDNGITNIPVIDSSDKYKLKGIEYFDRRCVRLTTGVNPPTKNYYGAPSDYMKWYHTMIGKSCAGRKCPHFGTIMIEQNGGLVCPMHGLKGDIDKEVIV